MTSHMFKFSTPTMKLILSSGSFLTLIALGCLVVMSTSVHTSDIHERSSDPIGATAASILTTSPVSTSDDARAAQQRETAPTGRHARQGGDGGDSRHRSGRSYQSQTQQQQQSPLESYAAAYAAANSGASGADQSALTQQSVAVGSQPSDSSFGEAAAAPPSAGQIARQLASSPSDYPAAHSSYFAGYMSPSSNEVSYSGAAGAGGGGYSSPGGNHHLHHHHKVHQHNHHHQQWPPLGYPTNAMYEQRGFSPMTSGYYDRIAHSSAASSPLWATSSLGSGGGGLMSSASHALSHWTNGFSIGEIICGLVAIAIGAIILGAPFFLIYLALMGNFSGSGTLSLTNPTSASGAAGGAAAPANGRRKRLAVFEAMNVSEQTSSKHPDLAAMVESVANSLGPYVNLQQVSSTFKQLVRSIEKYSAASAHSEHAQQVKPRDNRSSKP